ncbi:hypothetical protein A9Q84_12805 [Halobacteriovorax marinus]|uniref:Uncharacterized protein n=1 Tax=Halobacteriovorax marinus TaxID=97084 RepID=A0A1Y5FE80_9BACT|nr:hypothetical protein A9Q84_12805 [Halobacteriovorax marinus]
MELSQSTGEAMNLISVVDTLEQAAIAKASGVKEVLLGNMLYSRFGKISPKRYSQFIEEVKNLGLRVVFDWDILMTETDFDLKTSELEKFDWSLVDSVRVQDPGALKWIKDHYPTLPIQYVVEDGNHNLIGLKTWKNYAGENLERLVLSIELPKAKLEEYIRELKVPIEILVAGRIVLFYTPRNLVSPYLLDHDDEGTKSLSQIIEIEGSSEETPHKGFPITENLHGTFMFNTKDQFLCDQVADLKEMGLSFARIDIRHFADVTLLPKLCSQLQDPSAEKSEALKEAYPGSIIRGFYHVNKSDVLFKKLKNQRTQRKDESYLGDVLDVKKKKHLAIIVKSRELTLKVGMNLTYKTPDGKEKTQNIEEIFNSSGKVVDEVLPGEIGFVSHVGGISVKTMVYCQ